MGLKLSHQGPPEWHHLPTTFHENLRSSKDIRRSFISEASYAFRLFLPYSKQLGYYSYHGCLE
jgi:hypothetical protein